MSIGGRGDEPLRSVLTRSHELGFIGDPDLSTHIDHARGFLAAVERVPSRTLDLGSGGGLPGLVLAWHGEGSQWVLLDGSPKRTAFLAEAADELGLSDRVTVVTGRAEEVGRDPALRGGFDLVVARAFGAPAVLAECAAPFLQVGGQLVVSEPPGAVDRWSHPEELAMVGLAVGRDAGPADDPTVVVALADGSAGTYCVMRQVQECPSRYPRRVGIPAKRPLFS